MLNAARRHLGSDVAIIGGSVAVQNLLRLVSTIVLTRLLAPDDFGAVGVVTSVLVVITMISDLGFRTFIIRHQDGDTSEFLDVIWTFRLARAFLLCACVALLAQPVSQGLGKPELAGPIAASGLVLLLQGAESLGEAVSLRHRRLWRVTALELSHSLIQLVGSIALAMALRSFWGIIIAMILSSLGRSVLSYLLFPSAVRRPRWNRSYVIELLSFSRYIAPATILTLLISQADKILFSKVFTLAEFGIYMIGWTLATAPTAFSVAYASRVLFPGYAEKFRATGQVTASEFYEKRHWIAVLFSLGVGLLIGAAPLVVNILYDPRYAEAALYLQILACGSLFSLSNQSAAEALTAIGRIKANLEGNLLRVAWLISLGSLGYLTWGSLGLVAAVGTVELPVAVYSWAMLGRQRMLSMWKEIAALAAGVAGFGTGLLLTRTLLGTG